MEERQVEKNTEKQGQPAGEEWAIAGAMSFGRFIFGEQRKL